MTRVRSPAGLERLVEGAVIHGVIPEGPVTVVAAARHGATASTLTYRLASGEVRERLVYADEASGFEVDQAGRAWAFDGDGALFRLVAEARRIRMAHLFDPMLAVHLSRVDPLPHQILAVYREMLGRQPLRFCLADDPGAGKTVMAGLLIKELLLRGDLARCLVVAPGGLVAQWQDELADKFGLEFSILTRELIEASKTADPFGERDLLIARLDHLSRNEDLQVALARHDWDLVVVDEAHRMSAHYFGSELKETKRYRLGKLLGASTRHLLLMTATPHAGKDDDFQLFMALLDADRFEGRQRDAAGADTGDLMLRRVKEELLTFEGRRLFPERRAYTVPYPLSDSEAILYELVTSYVAEEMNRAERLAAAGEGRRGNRVGFALTVLQRRLASSPEAIYQSLARRRKRLEARLAEARARGRGQALLAAADDWDDDLDPDDLDDLDAAEIEMAEERALDQSTSSETLAELAAEIDTLSRLERVADEVRRSGEDRKWSELVGLLGDHPEMFHADGSRRKLIIFTEHRDTLDYLVARIRRLLGRAEAVVTIHGGTPRDERRRVQELFTQEPDCVVLVATDAAGEGLNLQVAHLLVNYDLPWNPNRLEQRFGRVHRIGQTEVCHLWNLVARDTREGQVYARLLEKLDEQREALGGQVFDVLGEALPGRRLQDLLIDAIRYGDQPERRAELERVIDASVGDGLGELVRENALSADVLSLADVERVRAELALAEARRLQPHYVRSFFLAALEHLGGRAREAEPGRYEITAVPFDVRHRDRAIGAGAPVLRRYTRICFDKALVRVEGRPPAELVAPGHPLLESVLDLIVERHRHRLTQGTVLLDRADPSDEPGLLVFLEHAITDGSSDRAGAPRVVSRRFQYVRLGPDGSATGVDAAPYLDFDPATPEETRGVLAELGRMGWPGADAERLARDHAIEVTAVDHLAEVRERVIERVERTRRAVKSRLLSQLNYWDHRANVLSEQAAAGKQPRMNPDRARQRADDLQARLHARMGQLDREEQLGALPPRVVGAALVAPTGFLARIGLGDSPADHDRTGDTEATELAAVAAVVAAEWALGRTPEVMPQSNPGFDIASVAADGDVWHIEVKGRIAGGREFTVTHNEIRHSLNRPDRFILAMAEVDREAGRATEVRYLTRPFSDYDAGLPFAMTSADFDWRKYWERASAPS